MNPSRFARHAAAVLAILAAGSGVALAQPAPWSGREPVDIHNPSAAALTDHQVRLTIDTASLIGAGRLRPDAADLRFGVDPDGITPIPYWIESGVGTASTVVWISVPSLPAQSHVAVWMYVGNPAATSESTLDAVFPPSAQIVDDSASLQVFGGQAGGVANSQRGFRFSANEDVLVVGLGKCEPTGSTRYITLFDWDSQAVLEQQQIAGPACTAAAEYAYAALPEPRWLAAGKHYTVQMHQGDADGYYFGNSSQVHPALTYINMPYCNGCTQDTFPTNVLNGIHYGYPDLLLRTRKAASPQPVGAVGAVPSAITIGADADPSLLGEAVTFTAQVDASLDADGTVSFAVDGADACVDVPLAAGVAQCVVADLALGTRAVTAAYSGTTTVQPATATYAHTVHILPPGAPTGLVATPGDMQLTVTLSPPAFVGGSAVDAYTVSCSDGTDAFSGVAAASPVVVAGLVNGVSYTCAAHASNDAGDGPLSDTVQGTPARVPDAPTGLVAVAGQGEATLTFGLPADGGAPILAYTAACSDGSTVIEAEGTGSPLLVTGLVNGVDYDCVVFATNAMGDGPASNDASVFPQGVPGPPVALTAVPADMQATLHFGVPLSDGGSPIIEYYAMCEAGATLVTKRGPASPLSLFLQNDVTWRCVVSARNAFGYSVGNEQVFVTPPDDALFRDGFEPIALD